MDHPSSSGNPSSSLSSSVASVGQVKKNKAGKRSKGVKLSTDPQSVAARERRHRISDRFKILQSLVPGGTKMDTVSMLEEAIHYVKYLKTQIWLHQTMINFADDDLSLLYPSDSLPSQQQEAIYSPDENLSMVQPYVATAAPVQQSYCYRGEGPVFSDSYGNYY